MMVTLPWHTEHQVGRTQVHVFLEPKELKNHSKLKDNTANTCKRFQIRNKRPGVIHTVVALCTSPNHRLDPGPSLNAASSSGPQVAACLPPIYAHAQKNLTAVLQHAEEYIAYHLQLGVTWTFAYALVPLGQWKPIRTTVLHMPWVKDFPLFARGQEWFLNDCVHRAAAKGFTWAVNFDMDERVVLPTRFPTLSALAAEAHRRRINVVTFGSRPGASVAEAQRNKPQCREPNRDPNLCLHLGRRKYLVHTMSAWAANLHTVTRCRPHPCHFWNHHATNEAFVAHLGNVTEILHFGAQHGDSQGRRVPFTMVV